MIATDAREALIEWYRANGRDLPWRRTRDPYRIMVSEIMLQQTQVERVIPKYEEFLREFPSLKTLADAPRSAVIRAWAGLGYNRRALNLQRACAAIVANHGGEVPSEVEQLLQLPGIGPYTAGAIACFAFEQDVAVVDTNIRRVLHRVHAGPEHGEQPMTTREITSLAMDSVPQGEGYVWNQSLMELGALICKARIALCDECPIAAWCMARPIITQSLRENAVRDRKPEPKFETTNRFLRGRIVALLRESASGMSQAELSRQIDPKPSEVRLSEQLRALTDEGFVVPVQRVAETAPEYDSDQRAADATVYRLLD